MRFFLPVILILFSIRVWSQSACSPKSALFQFDPQMKPRAFTEKLGNHPQFPFLQQEHGVSSRAAFLKSVRDPANRKTYKAEFGVFNELLKEIGFSNGYRDLKLSNVENLYINPGTIGNLGFFHKENGYIYVRLNPAGEGEDGIAAWRVTGPEGCYFYILHTCGNAFFAHDPGGAGSGCCREVAVNVQSDTMATVTRPRKRPLLISLRLYQASVTAARTGYDTVYQLVRSVDTSIMVTDSAVPSATIRVKGMGTKLLVCRDTVLTIRLPVETDTAGVSNPIRYSLADTTFVRESGGARVCRRKWEIAADGGVSFNSIPRYDNTTRHTRTNGAQLTGELAISRIFNHWLQAGIVASYMVLSYQDDLPYAGSVPNTYNTVFPARPMVPLQLFGKATIGGPRGWQSTVSLTAGYSVPVGHGEITDNGVTLTAKPALKGGLTSGIRLGIAYFFTCSFGMSLTTGGQYFDNKGSTMSYRLVALPVTFGFRFRF
ncbi:MAG TPA: hypothetical protein VMH27_12715 [Puia sp.]|nr:hypothetical protein [Puia sp.]